MHLRPVSDATHLNASFYIDSDVRPFAEINVIGRLEAATASAEVAVSYTGELFDALCDAYDADLIGVSLPQPLAWTDHANGVAALIGFELLPVLGVYPVARMAEMATLTRCPP